MAKARADAGLTQEEMAEKFGQSHSTIAKWEKDKSQPRDMMSVLEKWSTITKVPVTWLLGLEGSKTSGKLTTRQKELIAA